jgi:DNA-binding beta-propeller fold protein YncE
VSRRIATCAAALAAFALSGAALAAGSLPGVVAGKVVEGERLPTGAQITPEVAPGSVFQQLNPGFPGLPDFVADHAVTSALSPDGKTLFVLTSGFNRIYGPTGQIDEYSNEYVFIYDVGAGTPVQKQVVLVPYTFFGLAVHPNGREFFLTGGVQDLVRTYALSGGVWAESGAAIALNHPSGITRPQAAGLALNARGDRLLVADLFDDAVSLVDLASRTKVAGLDLRPGRNNPAQQGVPGGEYPFWVEFKGNDKAYVSSLRDREVVVVRVGGDALSIAGRIPVGGQPNKMLLNRAQNRLYVACDATDQVVVIDTATDAVVGRITASIPNLVVDGKRKGFGAAPNGLALSPDEKTLYVTCGGLNAVAVVRLAGDGGDVAGLIPTGHYPSAVTVSADGRMLYVSNAKSNSQPNPNYYTANEYVWQLKKAGLLSLPVPDKRTLDQLTYQAAYNNNAIPSAETKQNQETMAALRQKIKHVIYIVKENRTYDMVLGDLEKGNGDPSLTVLPEPITPNHHKIARDYILFDNFYDSGESSNMGWPWSTMARANDYTEKSGAVNYAGRGLEYDQEGTNRYVNVGIPTLAARIAALPILPPDPDLLPGTLDVAAGDSAAGEANASYLWDAALAAGKTVRNYGFYGDIVRYFLPDPLFIPISRTPFADGIKQFIPAKEALAPHTDLYFRGYDQKNADFYLFREWEREFDQFVAAGTLPNLSLVRFPHDHFGDFGRAIDGVNTVEAQMADNDYALGLLLEKLSQSPFGKNTLVFVIEDDCQDGPDHVNSHRSFGFIVGPYVKRDALSSKHYTTVNMIRTMVDVLGISNLGLYDGLAEPMADAFDLSQPNFSYTAIVPEVLRTTQLPLPAPTDANSLPATEFNRLFATPKHDAAYWEAATAGQDFTSEDKVDSAAFNAAIWAGLKGEAVPYPTVRDGRDLRSNRAALLEAWRKQLLEAGKQAK